MRRPLAAATWVTLAAAIGGLPACTPPSLLTMRSALDSMRAVVDTMAVRDSIALVTVQQTQRELTEQRDILLSTRATAGSTTQELFEQMQRLEGKLDEVMGKFQRTSPSPNPGPAGTAPGATSGASPGSSPAGADANQLYDQAAQDLTQGRYSMALQGFREFVQRFPNTELTDNARYGIGESFFAQTQYDSAAAAYALVDTTSPDGDRAPAALYKRALCEEKLGRASESRKHLEELVQRFPLSGEAQLARERLGTSKKR